MSTPLTGQTADSADSELRDDEDPKAMLRRYELERWERENPLAENYAHRYANAIDSFEDMLGGWFSISSPRGEVWDSSPDSDGSRASHYRMATDDEAAIADLQMECSVDIDLRGDIAEQLLDGFRELARRCRLASRDVKVALAAGTLDLRPMLGYVAMLDGKPLCEPCGENRAWDFMVEGAEMVPVFDEPEGGAA